MGQDPTGWMPGVEHIPTQAYGYEGLGEDETYPRAVMSHVMQGYLSTMVQWAEERPYRTAKSAQFLIGRDGRIVQTVSIWDASWAAGDVRNPDSIGGSLLRQFGPNPNRWAVNIEHEGFSINPGYGYDYLYSDFQPWPEAMIQATIRVHQFIFAACANWLTPSENTVITHSRTNTVQRPQDPGDLWLATVQPRILAALTGNSPAPPPPVDQFQEGRKEMYEAWLRDAEAYAEHVRSRRAAWGVID